MSEALLASFREAYRNLELLPLLAGTALDRFWVDYGAEAIEELEQLIEDSPAGDSKIIFTGHRGCGKSTLLAQLSRQLADRYFVVFFSIADAIEMSDVNHINILFAIAVRLMAEAEQRQIEIQPSVKQALHRWFASHTRTETEVVGADASVGFNLFQLIAGKLKADATIRNEIKQEFLRKVSDLIARINEIAAVVEAATQQEVLVIIDDLDKLDLQVVREIYQDHIKALFQPNFRLVLTIPISALRQVSLAATIDTETNNQIVQMPVAKLFHKDELRQPDAVPIADTMMRLQAVLKKRLQPELIEPEALQALILQSGGVLRELIRIANECCRLCLRQIRRQPDRTDIVIDKVVLIEAVNKLRLDFDTRLGKADYGILTTTYRELKPDDPKEQRFLDLLHGLYVLEYRNHQLWYDVHPIVVELLRDREQASDG